MASVKDKRETALIKRVQRLRRQLNRTDKLPRSQFRSKRIKTLRGKLNAAAAELERYRRNRLSRVQRLALELIDHPRSRFVFSSPTGGTAKVGLQQCYAQRRAFCAATDRWVVAGPNTEKLLEALVALCDEAKGPVLLNCIINGSHRTGSLHYEFRACDIDKSSQPAYSTIARVMAAHGCGALNEDAYHSHVWAGPGGP